MNTRADSPWAQFWYFTRSFLSCKLKRECVGNHLKCKRAWCQTAWGPRNLPRSETYASFFSFTPFEAAVFNAAQFKRKASSFSEAFEILFPLKKKKVFTTTEEQTKCNGIWNVPRFIWLEIQHLVWISVCLISFGGKTLIKQLPVASVKLH